MKQKYPAEKWHALNMRGLSYREIADEYGVGKRVVFEAVYRYRKCNGLEKPAPIQKKKKPRPTRIQLTENPEMGKEERQWRAQAKRRKDGVLQCPAAGGGGLTFRQNLAHTSQTRGMAP